MKHVVSSILVGLTAILLSGCQEDINLRDIDTTARLEMGLALPVGEASMTLGEVLGLLPSEQLYIDSIANQGVITFKDTFMIDRQFHPIDLSQYISSTTLQMNVYEKLEANQLIGANNRVIGLGMPITLDFPIRIKLQGINGYDKQSSERIDSALIENASFTSRLTQFNQLPLAWEWIDQVTLDLGDHVRRPAGNMMVVYQKGDGYGYGQDIPTAVDHFSIDLMRDHNPSSFDKYYLNVDSVVEFKVSFTFTIPAGEVVEVPENAGFSYSLGVQFIDFNAIWGMFEPSKDMFDESVTSVYEQWNNLNFLRNGFFPFADPSIDLGILTEVAGALVLDGDYLFVENVRGERIYADFNNQRHFQKNFKQGEYLSLDSEIGSVSENMHILFDKDPERGHIDRLFGAVPNRLGYKFNISIDQQRTPQMRITPNTGINAQAVTTLPLIFREGLAIHYQDTIRNIDLAQLNIDSILDATALVDTVSASDLIVIMHLRNSIPLDIYGVFTCLDEHNRPIMDPSDPSRPLRITEQDTLHIPAPEFQKLNGQWSMLQESESTHTLQVNRDWISILPTIHSIVYDVTIDDRSFEPYFRQGMSNYRITEDNRLSIKLGVAAHVDATITPNEIINSIGDNE